MNLLPPTFRAIATVNPVTYIIEGMRGLVLSDWSNPAIWQGFVVAGVMFIVMVTLTLGSFQKAQKVTAPQGATEVRAPGP